MFVLSEIVDKKLFALAEVVGFDAFHQCFEDWQDISRLYSFFKENPQTLSYYGVDIKTAVRLVLKESQEFFEDILNIAEGKSYEKSLDDIVFQPLHIGDDFDLPIIETKAYGTNRGKSFLRLYAIRLKDGTYIIVGGLIKSTKSLQESKEGRHILDLSKRLAEFLRKNNYVDSFDIGVLVI